jgi:hypothetical protein
MWEVQLLGLADVAESIQICFSTKPENPQASFEQRSMVSQRVPV